MRLFSQSPFLMTLLSVLFMSLTACQEIKSTSQLPTPMPTAAFLPWAYPKPSSVIKLADFRTGYPSPNPNSQSLQNAVCIELNGNELIEGRDNGLELVDYLERSMLIVDDRRWSETEPKPIIDLLGSVQEVKRQPETGEVTLLRSNATGPYTICWQIELNKGIHNIEFQTLKTSGDELSYSWSFLISD
jgi:hypothetical protein